MRGVADEVDLQLASNKNAMDGRLYVEFKLHSKRNPIKSEAEGRAICDDVEYVRILVPGDKNSEIFRPAMQKDREAYPRQYAAFLAKGDQAAASGTPLTHVLWLKPSQVDELRYFNCLTLEQLAAMPDTSVQKFPGGFALRQKARDAIEVARGNAPVAQLRGQLEEETRKRVALEERLAEMAKELKAMQAKSK